MSLMVKLSNNGIETRPFFVPVNQQPVFANEFRHESYPNAEMLSEQGLNLPSGNTLTAEQVQYVADVISLIQK